MIDRRKASLSVAWISSFINDSIFARAQKAEIIKGVTDLLVRVLDKDPNGTFVVIDEVALEDWGVGGLPVDEFRRLAAK